MNKELNGPGFYQLHGNELLYAPNFVENLNFQLYAEKHEEYEYPVEGWYWFDGEESARKFLLLPPLNETLPLTPSTTSFVVQDSAPSVMEVKDKDEKVIGHFVFMPGTQQPPSFVPIVQS